MGVILLVARVFDAFNDPIMGVIVAKTKTRWGKFRPWLLIGTLTNAVILYLMFSAPTSLNAGGLVAYAAVTYILWLHEQGVVMVEQPMPKTQLDDIAWVTQQSPLPIFADESIQRLADIRGIMGAFTGINIKLMKCTGMREGWKMVNTARALGMKVMVGCMTETSCGISAAAQFSPAVDFADLDGNLLIANDRFKGVLVEKGKLQCPTCADTSTYRCNREAIRWNCWQAASSTILI